MLHSLKKSMLIEAPNISSQHVRAFFTTRSWTGRDDTIDGVLARRFNISGDNIYLPVQKHTGRVHVLESDMEPVIADAVVTNRVKVFIGIVVADCVPILLCDVHRRIIGAVHAGWRGTARQIVKNTINVMRERFGSLPGDISVAIGPSIRACSYEVGEDVKSDVEKATGDGDYSRKAGDKYFIDLASANAAQALKTGIAERNIWQSDECTYCSPHKYFSYRYAGGTTGRQGGFIGMW